MNSKILLGLIVLVILLTIAPVSGAAINNFTSAHGETWIRWSWDLSGLPASTTYVVAKVDGTEEMNVVVNSTTPSSLLPTELYLTDLQPNERHSLKLYLLDNSTWPPAVLATVSDTDSTTQPATYYYLIFALAILLLFASLALTGFKYAMVAIIFDTASGVLSLYLGVSTWEVNTAFGMVCYLGTVIAAGLLIYLIHWIWTDKNTWRD